MRAAIAALAGLIFGIGLTISEMTNPAKVLAFLDLFSGQWDPSLIFVMGGGIVVYGLGLLILRRREYPVLAPRFKYPQKPKIDAQLVTGSALFGVGWGLVGLCPGPSFSALGLGGIPILIFLSASFVGMYGFEMLRPFLPRAKSSA